MTPTPELTEALACTCRIRLTQEECRRFCRDLGELEALCAPLLALAGECSDEYRARPLSDLREDRVGECLPPDAVMAMAPRQSDGYIVVPRAVEEGGAE